MTCGNAAPAQSTFRVKFLTSACLALLLTTGLTACVSPQTLALRHQLTTPAKAIDVPSVPNGVGESLQGAPVALAELIAYGGGQVSAMALATELQKAHARELTDSLETVARQQGQLVYNLQGNLTTLLAALHAGNPVLVRWQSGFSLLAETRFSVVVGADPARERLMLRSPDNKREEVSFSSFERGWAETAYWSRLILNPASLTKDLDTRETLHQIAELEDAGALPAAQTGYLRAATLWPDEKLAWLGLANVSIRLGDLSRADAAYRFMLRNHPNYPAGLNSYARFLLTQNRPHDALQMAQRAVGLRNIPEYKATVAAAWEAITAENEKAAATAASGQ